MESDRNTCDYYHFGMIITSCLHYYQDFCLNVLQFVTFAPLVARPVLWLATCPFERRSLTCAPMLSHQATAWRRATTSSSLRKCAKAIWSKWEARSSRGRNAGLSLTASKGPSPTMLVRLSVNPFVFYFVLYLVLHAHWCAVNSHHSLHFFGWCFFFCSALSLLMPNLRNHPASIILTHVAMSHDIKSMQEFLLSNVT